MTKPLTPPDCDLRDFAFMHLDTSRLLDSDLFALATGDQFKAAIALWCKAWTQVLAGSLPDDDRVLAHLSGAGLRWRKVKAMALRGFVKCEDGRLYHTVLSEKACKAWAKKQSYRERSKKGNAKRWGSQKEEGDGSHSDPSGTAKGARANNVAVWIVAHPTKPQKGVNAAPSLYDVSDSAHWSNKADYGLVYDRRQRHRADE